MIELRRRDYQRIARHGIRTVAAELGVTPRQLNAQMRVDCRMMNAAMRALADAVRRQMIEDGEGWMLDDDPMPPLSDTQP